MSDPEDAGLLSYGIFGMTASQIRDDFQNTYINEAESGWLRFIHLHGVLRDQLCRLVKKVSCLLTVDRIM